MKGNEGVFGSVDESARGDGLTGRGKWTTNS